MQNGNGNERRLITPGQVNIAVNNVDGPLAEPVSLPLGQGPNIQVAVFGGLTKVEYLAGMVAGHLIAADHNIYDIASDAVDLAEAIIGEARSRVEKAGEE